MDVVDVSMFAHVVSKAFPSQTDVPFSIVVVYILITIYTDYNYVYCIYVYIHVIQELASKSDHLCDLYTGPAVVIVLS